MSKVNLKFYKINPIEAILSQKAFYITLSDIFYASLMDNICFKLNIFR